MKYKLYLKQRFAEELLADATKGARVAHMVHLIISAIRYVLQASCWRQAFAQTGIWCDQTKVSSTVLRKLLFDSAPIGSAERPTADMIRTCWPRNRDFPELLVMKLLPGGVGEIPTTAVTPSVSTSSGHVIHDVAMKAVPKRRLLIKTTLT